MDAVKFLETRRRMCSELACYECPLSYEENGYMLCKAFNEYENYEEVVRIVEEWAKDNPAKTRQSEFLKIFPKAKMFDDVLYICPARIESDFACDNHMIGCSFCLKKYWLAEVE